MQHTRPPMKTASNLLQPRPHPSNWHCRLLAGGSMGVQGRTFSPLVQPAAAPQLAQAQMDPSLATISVGFNQATNEVLCSAPDIVG